MVPIFILHAAGRSASRMLVIFSVVFVAQVEVKYKRKPDSHSCLLNARCAKRLLEVHFAILNHSLLLASSRPVVEVLIPV